MNRLASWLRTARRDRTAARMLENSRSRRRRLLLERLEDRALLAVTPIQVFLMIGQSNMDGAPSTADLTAPYDTPQSDVWIWQDDLGQNIGWTSLRGGFGGDSNKGAGGDGSQFGPELSLGRSVEDALPESQFAIIKHVQAGVAATMQDGWNPDRGGGTGPGQIWLDFVDKTNDALNALDASLLEYEIAGLFVAQGHRDINNETGVEAANYQQNFADFISGVRQQFGVPQLPVVFAQVTDTFQGSSLHEQWLQVRNAQEAVDAADPLATMIEVDDLSRLDGVHQDADGQITQGQRLAAVYLGAPYEGSEKSGSDGFETGNFSSGYEQWSAGAWTASGDVSVTTANSPHVSTYHAQLRSSTGDLIRAVDTTGLANVKLRFWSKLDSFETGDKASVQVSADGTNWTTVREFVDGEDDNLYRVHEIDIPDIGDTIYVRFDAQMNELTDDWYIDDVKIVGTTGDIPAAEAIFASDPDFSQQWELHNIGQNGVPDADIDAPEAWSVTTGSMITVLAEIDDGVDFTHPDLYLNIWLNQGEIPVGIVGNLTDTDNDGVITFRDLNSPANASYVSDQNANSYIDAGDLLANSSWENGLDEDGNGFTDDMVGWDFEDNDNDPMPIVSASHGTGMALYIGADANNGVLGVGINWRISMMPVRFWNRANPVDFAKMAAGLDYAVGEGAPISALYGGNYDYSQAMYDSINEARLANHLVIAPSGNDSANNDVTPRYPASFDLNNIISAMSVDQFNGVDAIWNYGATSVDLAAPTQNGGGTSGGAARTAGVAALLKSVHPDWTYAQIKDRILSTVDPLPSLAGKSVTGGRLNAANALGVAQFSISDATATEGSNAVKFLDTFIPDQSGGLARAGNVLFGPGGDLYVVSRDSDSVLRFDGETGAFVDAVIPSGAEGLDHPWMMTFGPDGRLYVAGTESDNIVRWDPTTGLIDTFIPASAGLWGPKGMAFDAAGAMYVSNADRGPGDTSPIQDQVLKFAGPAGGPNGEASGTLLGVFIGQGSGGLDNPNHIVFHGDHMYVTNTRGDSINRYDAQTGAFVDVFVPANSGGLDIPNYLVFRPDGFLYVSSQGTDEILRYDAATGAFVDVIVPARDPSADAVIGLDFDAAGNLYVGKGATSEVLRYGAASQAAFTISLSSPSSSPVTLDYATNSGTATAGSDYTSATGTITFAPGQTSRTILVQTLDDTTYEGEETFTVNLSNPVGGVIADGQGVGTIVDNDPPPTKFYVVDDASANRTYEYGPTGAAMENYALNSGNSAPRGAASTAAGDKVWVIDSNRKVFVYDASGGLLGSWTAGSLSSSADEQGIATNGTDVWIVDAKSDKVFRYANAAGRLSGSQNAASSFSLNSGNRNPKGIETDGTHLWVVNDASTNKVFKYTLSGSLVGSWTITGGNTSPTGITLDPTNPNHIWIVDSSADRVYQYDGAASRTSGSQSASSSFALAAGNTNPQGIADPPVSGNDELAALASVEEDSGMSLDDVDLALLALADEFSAFTGRKRR